MRLLPLLVALSAIAVPASAQQVRDFQLPPDPDSTASARQQAQGPTDLEGENRTAPRVIGLPTPAPRATPSAQPVPQASATPTARPSPQATRPAASGPALPATDRPVSTREVLTGEPATPPPSSEPDVPAQGVTADEPQTSEAIASERAIALPDTGAPDEDAVPAPSTADVTANGSSLPLLWVIALAGGVLAFVAGLLVLLRRRRPAARSAAEVADLSRAVPAEAEPAPTPGPTDPGSLQVEAYAITLSRSVMNATISYRVNLVNRGRVPISQIEIHGDVTTAHGRVPAAQQLADTEQAFPELHTLAHLDPGERSTVRGELRLPLHEVRALRQGSVPVFVPLLRLTVRADNMAPRAHTYVIGTSAADKGARPNPFRLDEPPRSYAQLTTRALA